MLLFSITVSLYYGSLLEVFFNQSVLTIDDSTLMRHLSNHKMQFYEIFNSGWQKKYFRPFIDFSYLVDQRLWGDNAFGFRTTNVLVHSLNVVLLYFMARMLLKFKNGGDEASFLAAILFAVHPIAVESVSWISGRSDSMATFWSLLAILFYLLAKARHSLYLVPSSLFAFLAILSKEVAIAVPLVIGLFEFFYCQSFGYRRSRYAFTGFLLFIIAIPLYMLFRTIVISGGDMGVGLIKNELVSGKIVSVLGLSLASLGFYIKKFIYPFPLNMMIFEVNTALYAAFGIIIILSLAFFTFVRKARSYCFLFFWAAFGIGPAALISFTDVAWTPWAERYLYFSLVPLSILSSTAFVTFYNRSQRRWRRGLPLLFAAIILLFMQSSYGRSIKMNSNELIWEDSYRKSPSFIGAAVGHAASLAANEKLEEAEAILNEAKKLEGPKHLVYVQLGRISQKKGNLNEAERFFRKALFEARKDKRLVTVGPNFRRDILISIAGLDLKRAEMTADENEKKAYYLVGIEGLIEAYNEKALSILHYKIAKIYLALGEKERAVQFLKKFIDTGQHEIYQKAAKRMLRRMNEEDALPAR